MVKILKPLLILKFMLLAITVEADTVNYKNEVCNHLAVSIENNAIKVLELKQLSTIDVDNIDLWQKHLKILSQYTNIYSDGDCDKVLLHKALYRLIENRKIGAADVLGKKKF